MPIGLRKKGIRPRLNEEGNVGKGYDFVVKKAEEEIEYVEVKTKISEAPESIEITGTQWGWARKLNEEGKGNEYLIYVVSNAGREDARIQCLRDPVRLWKEGRIKVHPIAIEI